MLHSFERYSRLNLDEIRENTTQLDHVKDMRVRSKSKGPVNSSRCHLAQDPLIVAQISPPFELPGRHLLRAKFSFCASAFTCRGTGKWDQGARRKDRPEPSDWLDHTSEARCHLAGCHLGHLGRDSTADSSQFAPLSPYLLSKVASTLLPGTLT